MVTIFFNDNNILIEGKITKVQKKRYWLEKEVHILHGIHIFNIPDSR